jgi:type IV pilus assembly protein PilV
MRHQSGFTLIEVMVAFMVMAIGLLGIMGLQNTAIRNNSNSAAQMAAVLLGKEMADLVRANSDAQEDRDYNNVTASNNSACVSATGCTALQMAQYDKWLWDIRVEEAMGKGAAGVVCVDSTPSDGVSSTNAGCDGVGDAWVVKFWWKDGYTLEYLEKDGHEFTTADLLFLDTTSGPSYYMSFMP